MNFLKNDLDNLFKQAISLLIELVQTPSPSGQEEKTGDLIQRFLESSGIDTFRKNNNIYAFNNAFDHEKPTLLLNSHHDTIKPAEGWIHDPFHAIIKKDKLTGLGSNDAGASLVALMSTFIYFHKHQNLNHNLVFVASAEEENTGNNGLKSVLSDIGAIGVAIVGEPTGMKMAIAERGLIVLKCRTKGLTGHVAHDGSENAIINAMKDISWFSQYQFPKESPVLGKVKMTVTMISAGTQHNVIPDHCNFTVDIRSTGEYTIDEILSTIRKNTSCEILKPITSLNPSEIKINHSIVRAAEYLGIKKFGSMTLSDQAVIDAPSVKIGPGQSERSHTADEFIYLSEIEKGIKKYVELLYKFLME